MAPATNLSKKRIIFLFSVVCVVCLLLTFRIGWIQIVKGEEYTAKAIEQQTRDVPIAAKRGIIYDTNGKELAVSASTNTIWARPADIKSQKNKKTPEELSRILADILEMDQDSVYRTITNPDRGLLRLAKHVEKEKADAIREQGIAGIQITVDVKRHYPMGAFAAHILGSTTDDNMGLAGIELQYDQYLSGISGRWIKHTDASGKNLSYGVEKYFPSEDGLNVVLTVDEVIQHYTEKAIKRTQQETGAARVLCIVMDPKTGDVLAMATTPSFDPNDPRTPEDPVAAEYVQTLSDEEKVIYWNEMWRNPMISDTYEPGSTFKLITTAIALEEQVTSLNDSFYCSGNYTVNSQKLRCWRYYNPHGAETLVQAVENSCNPVFIQLALRVGLDKYYEYLGYFGFTEATGIDYPGEGSPIIQSKSVIGNVELATISYGHGISVTPIQLITALSSLGNDGKIMEPRLVKELQDSSGNTVESFEPKVVRETVSAQTAAEMRTIMESVVTNGTGSAVYIPGYHVGGKTGTANKVENGKYTNEVYSSFFAMAPMTDPQIAVLLIVDEPQGVHFASQTAAPGVKSLLEETLVYMNIAPTYTPEELAKVEKETTVVPSVTGMSLNDAVYNINMAGLVHQVVPVGTEEDFVVADQYPKAGDTINRDGVVYIYKD